MSVSNPMFSRKGLWICVFGAMIACAWTASDAYGGKKNKNNNNGNGPSDTGQANGVAHRVAALEAGLAGALDMIAVLDGDLATVEGQVATLEGEVELLEIQVFDLGQRVAILEAAAAPVP